MHWLEKWLFPPTCVITQQACQNQDLHPDVIKSWHITQPICPRCAEPSAQGRLCGRCLRKPPVYYRSQIGFAYTDTLRELVHQFKYQRQLYLSRLLAEVWYPQLDTQQLDALIPIPLHRTRLGQRGFNQAFELARMLSRYSGIPLKHALIRHQPAPSQTQLNAKQRARNLRHAFSVGTTNLTELNHVALIDDVMTTGATLQAAARCLHQHAPHLKIQAWALAKPYH
jgi:ComF family protein